MQKTKNGTPNLTSLLVKAHQRLSKGMEPGAYAELKKKEGEGVEVIEKQLEENFTPEGILHYQSRMIKGFKLIGYWN